MSKRSKILGLLLTTAMVAGTSVFASAETLRWARAGDSLTLADFTAAAHLSCLDYISDVDWNRSPVVKDWYAKIKSRPAFRSILADQVPGFRPPPHYTDLDF